LIAGKKFTKIVCHNTHSSKLCRFPYLLYSWNCSSGQCS